MAGYHGYSMSNNAVAAYCDGEKPYSKWTKAEILKQIDQANKEKPLPFLVELMPKLSVSTLRELTLSKSSWHHTSKYYNTTDFYQVDLNELYDLDASDILELIQDQKQLKTKQELSETWKCKFLEWGGTRNRPIANEIIEIGTIKGNWFYRLNGTKKSILSNGFEQIQKIKE